MSEDLIPISASSQRSIWNDGEVCAPAKSDTFVHERRIIPTATVPPDENTSIIQMNRKTGLARKKTFILFYKCQAIDHQVIRQRALQYLFTMQLRSEKKTLLHSFLLQFTCSVAHSLRSQRCLDVSLTQTIGRRAYRILSIYTMEPVSTV
ncbi:hypothetical protein TNCV_2941531 [Trichonephila clavipes]|nr:hypothetical protein TNCV_2941531 [Trichonephila clavipes]